MKNIKFSNIAWKDDGFYYSKYPGQYLGKTIGQRIYYHKLGTNQEEDKIIFKRDNNPEASFSAFTTSDERYLIIEDKDEKKGIKNTFYIDYNEQLPALKPLLTSLKNDENINIIDNIGDEFIASSFKGTNNGILVKINPSNPRTWKIVIPEYKSSLLLQIKLLEKKILQSIRPIKRNG